LANYSYDDPRWKSVNGIVATALVRQGERAFLWKRFLARIARALIGPLKELSKKAGDGNSEERLLASMIASEFELSPQTVAEAGQPGEPGMSFGGSVPSLIGD
jgi:hypothetical protein